MMLQAPSQHELAEAPELRRCGVRAALIVLLAGVAFVLPMHRLAVMARFPGHEASVKRVVSPPQTRLRATSVLVPRLVHGKNRVDRQAGLMLVSPPEAPRTSGWPGLKTGAPSGMVLHGPGSPFPLRC
jgi:hypothetical protein